MDFRKIQPSAKIRTDAALMVCEGDLVIRGPIKGSLQALSRSTLTVQGPAELTWPSLLAVDTGGKNSTTPLLSLEGESFIEVFCSSISPSLKNPSDASASPSAPAPRSMASSTHQPGAISAAGYTGAWHVTPPGSTAPPRPISTGSTTPPSTAIYWKKILLSPWDLGGGRAGIV